jgi:hypothetical protein
MVKGKVLERDGKMERERPLERTLSRVAPGLWGRKIKKRKKKIEPWEKTK